MTIEPRIETNGKATFQPADAPVRKPEDLMKGLTTSLADLSGMRSLSARAASRTFETMSKSHMERGQRSLGTLTEVAKEVTREARTHDLFTAYSDYIRDAGERTILFFDALRERDAIFREHEDAGCPPVLTYDYEVVVDGAALARPSNYVLLRILPPAGVEVQTDKRPYIIIDPRAGHGAGIGGFKPDSQVGVALHRGNPVYFVAFKRDPEPGQTLADVTWAEAQFTREVMRRHPKSPNPVIAGNCQGGWATLILAATNPDLTGPLLINGAPVDAWSGEVGKNPMRYNGGMMGGEWLAMLASDLGNGVFDGAHLVENFEKLNPSRNFFGKYYDLYAKIDTERARFLEFERWWGGFFLMNEAEITWIVKNIFVGNRLSRNEARLERGRGVDLKNIQAPIVVFTSHGDNITPPQQALNWIVETYANVDEIRIRGQRIIYLVHDTVGHLGIFVSGSVAKKEHTEVASTLRTIESLPPGLYEMVIEQESGEGVDKEFVVSFAEREMADIERLDDGDTDETPFAAVSRISDLQAEVYDLLLRPLVKAAATAESADFLRKTHPLRLQRSLLGPSSPLAEPLRQLAEQITDSRHPTSPDNPFIRAERLWSDMVQQSMDASRDMRDACYEMMFYGIYATPAMRWFGRNSNFARTLKSPDELRSLPAVQDALHRMERGGFVEAVIRMLILLADSRGGVRRDRLERSASVLNGEEPFRSLEANQRAQIIHEQTLMVEFDREGAIVALPKLLRSRQEREAAGRIVRFVPGAIEEMSASTLEMLKRIHSVLDLPDPSATVGKTGAAAE